MNCQALTERSRLLQENLVKTRLDLERNFRWTRYFEILTQIQKSQATRRSEIGFRRLKRLIAHSIHMFKSLCTRCENSGHLI